MWIGPGCYIGGVALNIAYKHERKASVTASDTLYVKLPDEYLDTNPVFDDVSCNVICNS